MNYSAITSSRRIVVPALLLGLLVAGTLPSLASPWGQQHPRRAEVVHRDNHINNQINRNQGNLGGHYGQLKAEDRSIRRQEQFDARMNGGHITRGEQAQLNREENHLERQVRRDQTGGLGTFSQNHPRRAEVLGRDNHLNNELRADRGDLSGHYGQLKTEDRAIRAQEQADARFNGGYITKAEQSQLNHEENRLQRQINRDTN